MQAISNREPKWLCTYVVFFFHDSATTEIYTYGHTLSLHDALPISLRAVGGASRPGYRGRRRPGGCLHRDRPAARRTRALEPAPRRGRGRRTTRGRPPPRAAKHRRPRRSRTTPANPRHPGQTTPSPRLGHVDGLPQHATGHVTDKLYTHE